MANSFYKQKHKPQTSAVYSFWMDGMRGDDFEGSIHTTGGWNPTEPNPDDPGNPLRRLHLKSVNNGVTFTQLATPPWDGRHTHAHGVHGGFLWVSGGNDVIDLWKYSTATGWLQVTVTGVSVELNHFATTMVGKNITFFGGNLGSGTTPSNDIYNLDVETGILSYVAPIPAAVNNKASSGCLVFFKNSYIYFGGGDYQFPAPGSNAINTKVFRSEDRITWTEIADTALLNSGLWGDAVATDTEIWYQSGTDANDSVTANSRTLCSSDGITWVQPAEVLPNGRHACIMMKYNGDVYGGMGFGRNDFWRINKVIPVAAP